MPRNWKRKCPVLNILSKYYILSCNLKPHFKILYVPDQTYYVLFFKKKLTIYCLQLHYMYWRLIFAQTFSATDTYELQITTQFPSFLEVYYLFGI